MKKVVSILFLSAYLLATTQISELFKLPKLLEHYAMHQNWDDKETFLEFLSEHYTESNNKTADYDEDMKLPFKTVNNCSHSIASFSANIQAFKIAKKEKFTQPVKRRLTSTFLYSSNYFSNIWQPPKGC